MAIVAIDLGATSSLVSVSTDKGPKLAPNALGDALTPSAVSIADDDVMLADRAALDRLITEPGRSIASFKRWMGSAIGAKFGLRVQALDDYKLALESDPRLDRMRTALQVLGESR
jgi:molecular chaperone HscC